MIKTIIDSPIYGSWASMNIDQIVARACQEPTLLDALTLICIWESERIVKQTTENYGSGSNGAGWDTCFRTCLDRVMDAYGGRQGNLGPAVGE